MLYVQFHSNYLKFVFKNEFIGIKNIGLDTLFAFLA